MVRTRDGACLECVSEERRAIENDWRRRVGKPLVRAIEARDRAPRRWAGTTQSVVETIPNTCPKCGDRLLRNRPPMISCLKCGWDAAVVPQRVEA